MATKKKVNPDSKFVSREPYEIDVITRKFKSSKTDKTLTYEEVVFIRGLLKKGTGIAKRADLENALGILGFSRNPQIDER